MKLRRCCISFCKDCAPFLKRRKQWCQSRCHAVCGRVWPDSVDLSPEEHQVMATGRRDAAPIHELPHSVAFLRLTSNSRKYDAFSWRNLGQSSTRVATLFFRVGGEEGRMSTNVSLDAFCSLSGGACLCFTFETYIFTSSHLGTFCHLDISSSGFLHTPETSHLHTHSLSFSLSLSLSLTHSLTLPLSLSLLFLSLSPLSLFSSKLPCNSQRGLCLVRSNERSRDPCLSS